MSQDKLIGQSIIFPKSMLFSPDSVPVLGREIFPLTFVVRVSHVLHMGWPGLTVGHLPVPLCWGSWCLVHPRVASPPCHFGGTHPATERWSGGWTYFMAILRWLLQENLLPSVGWVLPPPLSSLEPQGQSQVPFTGDLSLASRHIWTSSPSICSTSWFISVFWGCQPLRGGGGGRWLS